LPGQVIAGQPLEIGFMVRQHGVTPLNGLTPTVHAQLAGVEKTLSFEAKQKGETGHYVARLLLPDVGKWQWSIEAFTGNQPMPALTVVSSLPAVEGAAETPLSTGVPWLQWTVGLLGASGVLAGLLIVVQRKARWAIALVLAGLLVSAASIVSAAGQAGVKTEALRPGEAAAQSGGSSLSQVDLGYELFMAKGCMICHSHPKTNKVREFGVDIGPNLAKFTASPEYLRLWLKDPKAVKSTATMPTLGLSEAEIEALIAFLNAK
jgi:cytochrome c2